MAARTAKIKRMQAGRFGGFWRCFILNASLKDRVEFSNHMPIPVIGGVSENEFDKLSGYFYENISHLEDISRGTVDPLLQESKPGCGERVGGWRVRGWGVGGCVGVGLQMSWWLDTPLNVALS